MFKNIFIITYFRNLKSNAAYLHSKVRERKRNNLTIIHVESDVLRLMAACSIIDSFVNRKMRGVISKTK